MRRSCRYENRVARMRQDSAAAEAETHPTRNHGELLLLDGMDVPGGNVTSGRQKEVEGEQPAAGLRATLANDDTLAADRIVDHVSRGRNPPTACVLGPRFDRSTGALRLSPAGWRRSHRVPQGRRQPPMLVSHARHSNSTSPHNPS